MNLSFTSTYLIGLCNSSVSIVDLVSHTACVVCVNFIHKWRDLHFKVEFERQIFLRYSSWLFYLLSEFLSEICWKEIAEEIFFTFNFFWWQTRDTNPGFWVQYADTLHTRPRQLHFLFNKIKVSSQLHSIREPIRVVSTSGINRHNIAHECSSRQYHLHRGCTFHFRGDVNRHNRREWN